ncbi:hypothetical protein PInf_009667 [Phytophthora infestans]|nr:hypothetical protein PInf_010556 [Phytophthora infestans]KAI9981887.1 hypothetical protein PInf_009667 [Phytophthora infestans]
MSPITRTKPRQYATFTNNVDEAKQRGYDAEATTPATASFWSKLFFSYANPMMDAGNQRQLNLEDLWELEGKNRAATALDEFGAHYERHDRSITRAMASAYGREFLLWGLAMFFSTACGLFAPVVLNHAIDALSTVEIDMNDLSGWLGIFFASRFANAILSVQMNYALELIALRLTVTLKTLLFQKAMRRSLRTKNNSSTVDIANLLTSDVNNVLWATFQVNKLWVIPIQIVVAVWMLYAVIDLAAFAGLAVIAVSMLASYLLARFSGAAFADLMQRKDERLSVVKEVFNAIQVVKLNAWEGKFAKKIRSFRSVELSAVKRFLYLGAVNITILWSSPLAVSAVSFAVYAIVMGNELTAAKVFTAIALYNTLRDPLRDLPTVIQMFIQAKISIDRFSDYLSLEEFNPANVSRSDPKQHDDVVMAIKDGIFGWTKDTPLLSHVDLAVKQGDLVIVHGSVGSGKSSLCSALLGEMDKLAGNVFVRGRVAYYSQQTWIQNMTIRDNILFGLPYHSNKYAKAIAACGLLPDLKQFPGGDLTEIGQKGVNLSGGQKARVCLARACYSDADIFLLDSPLAAVDAIVQSQIFGDCICNLLAEKTVVLVTHSPDIIANEAANMKVLVEDGNVKDTRNNVDLPRTSYTLPVSPRSTKDDDGDIQDKTAGRFIDEEERVEGRVSKDVFLKYFDSLGGLKVCIFLFVVQMLRQAFQIGSDLWLSRWTGQKYYSDETVYNVTVYDMLGVGTAVMVLVRAGTVAVIGLRASRHLFDTMKMSLLKAPLRFFDANPIGRILNRISASPILSYVSQSEEGVAVIRAFGQETVERMVEENFRRNDVNCQAWFAQMVLKYWFQLRMQLVGFGVVTLVVSSLVYLHNFLTPGLIGLAFTYALSVDGSLASLVMSWSWLEIQMVGPERILEYGAIPAEGSQRPLVIEPDASWPRSSTVQFQDVVFSYKPGGKPVLKSISFSIQTNEKIGIVGRTGAGKSSLTMALFRINELVSGRILIDGVDIATMPLRTLRSNLSIIPQ